ncbi:unnamed protein product [Acanthoscelides obtectus]|uniref:Uncharacterized protein n=1 Tax=Acanthoscelides obtectus TaxID=200917 RepID=A0A9P0KAG2_ACAOB|nr:unnamed protein product [Acanthoscelides obtectus]CAK1633542.1 hypothetical protein AOBTE_LOCUS8211 [Acanthoscelides obtectus]
MQPETGKTEDEKKTKGKDMFHAKGSIKATYPEEDHGKGNNKVFNKGSAAKIDLKMRTQTL